ncbi:MAG: efflux RND transporter periplasmic adaptor subunit, partial [Pseudomonadota bacterium]
MDVLTAGIVATFVVIGFKTGVRARIISTLCMGVGIGVAWALMMYGRDFLDRIAAEVFLSWVQVNLVIGGTLWIVLALGARIFLRHERPAFWSRFGGGLVGVFQGGLACVIAFAATAELRPGWLASQTKAETYPTIRVVLTSLEPALGGRTTGQFKDLPLPAPVIFEETSLPPRPVMWIALPPENGASKPRVFTGTIQASARGPASFEVGGTIARIERRLGDEFSAGEVLAQLDTTALLLTFEESRARLEEAQASLVEAQLNYDRQSKLLERGVVAQATVDSAQAALDSTAARVAASQAALDRAEDTLSDAVLRAPYDGRVSRELVEIGEVVGAGQAVMQIEDRDAALEIVTNVPDTVVSQLTIGEVHSLTGRGAPLEVTLTEIGSRTEGAATFPVVLELPRNNDLRPGMTHQVTLKLARDGPQGRSIPLTAVVSSERDRGFVLVLDEADAQGYSTVQPQEVRLLAFDDTSVLIASDLPTGTPIVARGVALLSKGQSVAPIGWGVDRFEELGSG